MEGPTPTSAPPTPLTQSPTASTNSVTPGQGLSQPGEQVRFGKRRAGGVLRSDEGLLTEERAERTGRHATPERFVHLAGVRGERHALSFDEGTDVDHGCDACFNGFHQPQLLRVGLWD